MEFPRHPAPLGFLNGEQTAGKRAEFLFRPQVRNGIADLRDDRFERIPAGFGRGLQGARGNIEAGNDLAPVQDRQDDDREQ